MVKSLAIPADVVSDSMMMISVKKKHGPVVYSAELGVFPAEQFLHVEICAGIMRSVQQEQKGVLGRKGNTVWKSDLQRNIEHLHQPTHLPYINGSPCSILRH